MSKSIRLRKSKCYRKQRFTNSEIRSINLIRKDDPYPLRQRERTAAPRMGPTMPRKLVEITTEDGKTYHDTYENATAKAQGYAHRWEGMRKLVLVADNRLGVTWAPRQSGPDGPLVLQVVSR